MAKLKLMWLFKYVLIVFYERLDKGRKVQMLKMSNRVTAVGYYANLLFYVACI